MRIKPHLIRTAQSSPTRAATRLTRGRRLAHLVHALPQHVRLRIVAHQHRRVVAALLPELDTGTADLVAAAVRQLREMPNLRAAQHLKVAHNAHRTGGRLVHPQLHHLINGRIVVLIVARLADARDVLAGVRVLLRVAALVVLELAVVRMAGGHIGQLVAPLHLDHALGRLEAAQLTVGDTIAERIVQLDDVRLPNGRHLEGNGVPRTAAIIETGALRAGAMRGRRLAGLRRVAAQIGAAEFRRIVGGRSVGAGDGNAGDDAHQAAGPAVNGHHACVADALESETVCTRPSTIDW